MKQMLICAFLMLLAGPALAAHDASKLTDKNIKDFIEDLTRLTNEAKIGDDLENIKSFLASHVREDAYFKSTMNYEIPGFPSQKNSLDLNKEQYIDSLTMGKTSTMDDYEAKINIEEIKISKDKRKATVQVNSTESGLMHVEGQGHNERIPMEGRSQCNQILMLSDDNKIQVYSANCRTDMSFQSMF